MGLFNFLKRTPTDEVVNDIDIQERQLEVVESRRKEFMDTLRIIRNNIKAHVILDNQGAKDLEHVIDRLVAKSADNKSVTIALKTAEDLSLRILQKKNVFGQQDIREFSERLGKI